VLRVKGGLAEKVRPFGPHQDIPELVLRTLAVIVAKAPVAQAEVVKLRGQRAYSHIRELISRGFVRAQDQGQTKILTVTEDLLAYFGAQKLEDLQAQLRSAQPPTPLIADEHNPY
jgi:segregation and condensation protein B